MEPTMKKLMPLVVVVAVVFLGYWMFTDPARLAEVTKETAGATWDLATQLFEGLIDFINALFS
jgi:hypothetical protein